jgi:hypothetical protein
MPWLTLEQFSKIGSNCCKCDKIAEWLPKIKDAPAYCDEHYPYWDVVYSKSAESREYVEIKNKGLK